MNISNKSKSLRFTHKGLVKRAHLINFSHIFFDLYQHLISYVIHMVLILCFNLKELYIMLMCVNVKHI